MRHIKTSDFMRSEGEIKVNELLKNRYRKPHILLLFRQMIPSIRLCGHYQLEELNQQGIVEYRARHLMQVKQEDLRWSEIVIFGRADSWYEYQLARKLRSMGKKIAYILDDDLLNISHDSESASYFKRVEIRKNIQCTMGLSHAILSPSPILLNKYAGEVCEPLGLLIEEPATCLGIYEHHDPSEPVRIGFAGSADRAQDVETILKEPLLQIKSEYKVHVEFQFYGVEPSYVDALDADVIPYCESYDGYKQVLNQLRWDIGLAPMPETSFHACKHYNKYIEYAGAGVVGIYSEVEPYSRLKAQGGIGVFVENNCQAWYGAIKSLIEDREQLEMLRAQVYEIAQTKLNVQMVAAKYMTKIDQIVPEQVGQDQARYRIALYKVGYFLWKAFFFIKHYRFHSIQLLWAKLKKLLGARCEKRKE